MWFLSARSTLPAVGTMRPLHTLSVVDFPEPFGPSSANTEPWGTTRSMPWTTSMRPYAARTPLSSSRGASVTMSVGLMRHPPRGVRPGTPR